MEQKKNACSSVAASVQKVADEALVGLFQQCPEEALAELQRRYGAYCFQIAYRVLKNREDAEECVGDVLLRCWETFPQAAPRCLRAYLGATARNLAITRYRKQHTEKRCGDGWTLPLYGTLAGNSQDLEEMVCHDLLVRQCLRSVLEALSSENQKLFLGYYVLGMPVSALTAEFSLSEPCLRGRLYRMKLRFRRELARQGLSLPACGPGTT